MGSNMFPVPPGGGSDKNNPPPYFLQQNHQLFQHAVDGDDVAMDVGAFIAPAPVSESSDTHCHSLLYNLSVLRDKVQQLQPLVGLAVAHDDGSVAAASSGASAVIQEIIGAASSMMYAFQQLCHAAAVVGHPSHPYGGAARKQNNINDQQAAGAAAVTTMRQQQEAPSWSSWQQQEINKTTTEKMIIELDAAELLAKFTHYCQVCGKGFKRDANLRMHMRAHGDEYKSSAALANPANKLNKQAGDEDGDDMTTVSNNNRRRAYYSCPQEGCRWNRKHAKFQPLKSVICAKNHYKRSHCPKMYVCNRCNLKHFSVLSDLRTHEKHCGDQRWICSCGTSFSRKDKLVGHLALFAGGAHQHHPAVPIDSSSSSTSKSKRRSASSSTTTAGAGSKI